MSDDNTGWTSSPDENRLGLTDKSFINLVEAKGIAEAELYIFSLDENIAISATLILELHAIAFGHLYDWAGKWRMISVQVGRLDPPSPMHIPNLIYQYVDNLNHMLSIASNLSEKTDVLVYSHYQFVKIHPFNNGNGRTGRLIMNLIALKLGIKPLTLYYREGNSRSNYINALRRCDEGKFEDFRKLIELELLDM